MTDIVLSLVTYHDIYIIYDTGTCSYHAKRNYVNLKKINKLILHNWYAKIDGLLRYGML